MTIVLIVAFVRWISSLKQRCSVMHDPSMLTSEWGCWIAVSDWYWFSFDRSMWIHRRSSPTEMWWWKSKMFHSLRSSDIWFDRFYQSTTAYEPVTIDGEGVGSNRSTVELHLLEWQHWRNKYYQYWQVLWPMSVVFSAQRTLPFEFV